MSLNRQMSKSMPTPTDTEVIEATQSRINRVGTYGTVQHHDPITGQTVLNPRPSNDPNDPLNWKQGHKWYIACLVCLTMMACNYLAAGPTVQIVETTMDFIPDAFAPTASPTAIPEAIGKVAYFFTTTALFQGLSNLIWIPLMNKYGRRPMYLISFALYFVCTIWASFTYSYGSFLGSRICIGVAAGAAEGIAPVTISDIFFLHERGTVMALYTVALSLGVAGGIIVDGLISLAHPWRVDYYVTIAIVGFLWILIFFTFPETAYKRVYDDSTSASEIHPVPGEKSDYLHVESQGARSQPAPSATTIYKKHSYGQKLKVFTGTYTHESLITMMVRPLVLILLPQVLWASLTMSVTIGFLVAITSNFASAFAAAYGFAAWQSALCFVSSFVGSLIGIFFSGKATDIVADFFTRRNGGVREPEMRLPSISISCITTPLALVLYGAGIQYQWHWIFPIIGLGLLNFSVAQATNVSLVYTIDSYRPIAGEITVTQLAFKSAFGFLLSFYTNPWVAGSGYLNAFGAMAGIAGAVLLIWVPLYFFGKRIRSATAKWWVMKIAIWHEDRDLE